MLERALDLWATRFGGSPTVVSKAPGRVNLMGEHTDYNEGFVMPMAIDKAVTVLASESREDDWASVQVPDEVDRRGPGWRRYASACRSALESRGLPAPPMKVVVDSNVPGGSGLSSSAALELALLGAWNRVADLGLDARALADIAWQAENEFVGVKVGRMDQMASAHGVESCALFMDMRTLEVQPCSLPRDIEVAILDTRKPRSLAAGKYNERVAECARAVAAISTTRPIAALRDATLDDLAAAKDKLDETARRRAKHVITENARVHAFKDAIATGDRPALSKLFQESHDSLKDDYEVTVPELDAMVRAARTAPGCIGARMTGAGFGGCCVALIEAGTFRSFRVATSASYGMYGFATPNLFTARAAAGAHAWDY